MLGRYKEDEVLRGILRYGYYSISFICDFHCINNNWVQKNNRNLMLLGALLVGTGYFGLEFVIGFVESIEGIETSS